MIDHSSIRSGFDIEVLLGAEYVRALLLTFVETGELPLTISLAPPGTGTGTTTGIPGLPPGVDGTIALYVPGSIPRRYTPEVP